MANKDLRDWIAAIEAAGELHTITGADTAEEIGGIVDRWAATPPPVAPDDGPETTPARRAQRGRC